MRSLLKKKDKDTASESLAWHPDFRDPSRLPDTKTVRTQFFVNVVSISVTAALVIHVAFRELRLAELKRDLAAIEADIANMEPASKRAVAAFKAYQAEEKAFNEARQLVKGTLSFPDLLMHLGRLLPQGVRLQRVDYRGATVPIVVSGSVRGLDAAANNVASGFVTLLQSDEVLKEKFSEVKLTNLGRNAAEGNMSFELSFVPKK